MRTSELLGVVAEEKGNLISTIDLSADIGSDALFYDDPDIMVGQDVMVGPEVIPLIEGMD